VRDAVLAHRCEELRQVRGELREIEVAVGVDEHRYQRSGIRDQGSDNGVRNLHPDCRKKF